MKRIIQDKKGLNVWKDHPEVNDKTRILCDRIRYADKKLMFWNKRRLILTINIKGKFKDIYEALDYAGIKVRK